jgi:hypothetical protein
MLKRAVKNHDPDEALKFVNVDRIVENLAQGFVGNATHNTQGEGKNRYSLKTIVADSWPGMKESLRSSLRRAILQPDSNAKEMYPRGLAGGAEIPKPSTDGPGGDSLQSKPSSPSPKSQRYSVGAIEIGGLDLRKLRNISLRDLSIERSGPTATVYLKQNPAIKAKMVKTDHGHWEFTEVIFTK